MIAIDVDKLRLSMKELQNRQTAIIKKGDLGYRQKVRYLLKLAVEVSPQFSGDFASNWNIMVDGNLPSYKRWADKGAPGMTPQQSAAGVTSYRAHQRGDPEAVATSMARGMAQSAKVTMKSKVTLVNASDLETDGTHMIGRGSTETLRPQNIIPGRVRIESYVRARARERT